MDDRSWLDPHSPMDNPTEADRPGLAPVRDCWNAIGVWGNRHCPELKQHIHCRNCPVYSSAGRGLLERAAPQDYLEAWTRILAEMAADGLPESDVLVRSAEVVSAIVFRLGQELLALPVRVFQEVTLPCPIHTLPHRTTELFLGLTNVRGEILPYVSLAALLGIASPSMGEKSSDRGSICRTVVVSQGGSAWAFSADEVYGVQRFLADDLHDSPVSIVKASESYTRGIFDWNNQKVSYLDWDLLSHALSQKIL